MKQRGTGAANACMVARSTECQKEVCKGVTELRLALAAKCGVREVTLRALCLRKTRSELLRASAVQDETMPSDTIRQFSCHGISMMSRSRLKPWVAAAQATRSEVQRQTVLLWSCCERPCALNLERRWVWVRR